MKGSTRDRKQKVLDAAKTLFQSSHDMRKVSLEDIASGAGVSPTTVYNYFGTREALVAEVAKELVRAIFERGKGIIESDLPFEQKLAAVISGKLALTSGVNQEVITKMMGQDRNMAVFIDRLYQNELKPLWQVFLEDGKAQGYIDSSMDVDVFMAYLDILRAGFAAKPEIIVHFNENRELIEQLTRLVFYGFLKKEIDLFPTEGAGEKTEPTNN
jgi:AcrR family transcriptional regulator